MKQNSFQRLSSIALVSVSAGIFLGFPALAGSSNATSKDLLAQTTPSTPSRSTPPTGSPSDSPGTPTQSTPSDSSGSSSSPSQTASPASTPAKDSQSVKDPNVEVGGWTCLNNPNPQCHP